MHGKQNVRFIHKILDILYKLYLNECPSSAKSACQYFASLLQRNLMFTNSILLPTCARRVTPLMTP